MTHHTCKPNKRELKNCFRLFCSYFLNQQLSKYSTVQEVCFTCRYSLWVVMNWFYPLKNRWRFPILSFIVFLSGRQCDSLLRSNWFGALCALFEHVPVVRSTTRNWFHATSWPRSQYERGGSDLQASQQRALRSNHFRMPAEIGTLSGRILPSLPLPPTCDGMAPATHPTVYCLYHFKQSRTFVDQDVTQ